MAGFWEQPPRAAAVEAEGLSFTADEWEANLKQSCCWLCGRPSDGSITCERASHLNAWDALSGSMRERLLDVVDRRDAGGEWMG